MDFFIDFKKIRKEIKESNAKKVLIQLPDGLKPDFEKISDKLKSRDWDLVIWMGSCFGSCDIPFHLKDLNFDLIVHFGHEEFIKRE